MNKASQRILSGLILAFTAQMLLGCASISTNNPDLSHTPIIIESPIPDYAFAQATIEYGQAQQLDLSLKSTAVSLNMTQAANASALSTRDSNRHQKVDLDYQSTVVAANIAGAAATQNFVLQQTRMADDATSAAQSKAATIIQSAHLVNVTRTAQIQAFLDGQAVKTNQAAAGQTAYPLTATPLAVVQAALLMQEYNREQQSFINQVVAPLIPVFIILDMLLMVVTMIIAYRRYMIIRPWPRLLPFTRVYHAPRPMISIDQVFSDSEFRLEQKIPLQLTPANPPAGADGHRADVEIVDAAEPPFAHWIADAELQLAGEGKLQP